MFVRQKVHKNRKDFIMGMNVNRGFFNFDPNWKDKVNFKPGREINELTPEPIKEPEPGNMQPRPRGPQPSLEDILKNLDYKGFGQ